MDDRAAAGPPGRFLFTVEGDADLFGEPVFSIWSTMEAAQAEITRLADLHDADPDPFHLGNLYRRCLEVRQYTLDKPFEEPE